MTNPSKEPRVYMDWLQCLRGLSLLLVLFYHVGNVTELHLNDPRIMKWFGFGHCGVDVFFVISGFIMFYLHGHEFGQPGKVAVYLKKRFVRIYPIYWLLTTAVLISALLFSGSVKAYKFEPLYLLESYLLFPITYSGLPLIPPGWSLFHEVKFYAFFALLIALRAPWYGRWLAAWCIASLVGTGLAVIADKPVDFAWAYFWMGPYNLEFLAGCLAGWLMQKKYLSVSAGKLCAGIGMLILAGTGYLEITAGLSRMIQLTGYGLAGLFLVVGCISHDVDPATAKNAPRWLVLIGDASYSSYLAHYPLLFIIIKILLRWLDPATAQQHSLVIAPLLLAACLAGCLLIYFFAERPLMRFSRKWAGLNPSRNQEQAITR